MIDLKQAKKDENSDSSTEIEAIISFDERGQLVMPKDVRKKFGLNAGEKFALISCKDSSGALCCFNLIKVSQLQGLVKQLLGPALKDILKP